MLEGITDLTQAKLNEATQAWVEHDYNRRSHAETSETPLARFLGGPEVTRPSPDAAALRLAFTRIERRTPRRSDGTVTIQGRRFEVPNQYRHLPTLEVRYAVWDLTEVHLADPDSARPLCRLFPQDKVANANGRRRTLLPAVAGPMLPEPAAPPSAGTMAPLLTRMIEAQAATGLPPAYLPRDERDAR
jgi:hypothetical protein